MATGLLSPLAVMLQVFSDQGVVGAGYKIATYLAGSSTPLTTYTDSTLTVPNSNPIVMSATGRLPNSIWAAAGTIMKAVLQDATGAIIANGTIDNLPMLNDNAASVYPQTAAEQSAGVTPTIYVPSLHIDIERYGGVADNSTDNAAAFTRAIAVLTAKGGGTLLLPADGTYKTSGAILMPGKSRFQGDGMQATVLNYTGSGVFITFTSAGGSNDLNDLTLSGTGKIGTGIQFGDASSFTGLCNVRRCFINGFSIGIRFGGALWGLVADSYIKLNTTGIDFNATFASGHCNVVNIERNQISFNDREGVAGNNVPVRNQNIVFHSGSIEQNGVTDLTRYQLNMGSVGNLTVENVYFEYAAGGTKANGINLTGASNFKICESYFNTLTTAILATVANNGKIEGCRFIGSITNDLNLTGGVNVNNIEISNTNIFSGVGNVLAGTNVIAYTAARAQQLNTNTSFVPTIKGATTAGAPTYTVQQGWYSKVGNLVLFSVRVTISAIGGMVGAVSIEGLPLASSANTNGTHEFPAAMSGITVSGGNTYLYAELANNATSLQLFQGGSTTNAQLVATQLAAATTVVISGAYQTTSNS